MHSRKLKQKYYLPTLFSVCGDCERELSHFWKYLRAKAYLNICFVSSVFCHSHLVKRLCIPHTTVLARDHGQRHETC